ncbi:MAG: tetratricopeptide repeat protein [Rhabdochlamydiaceae bacterium]|nr:tetratricopeptide repeat protein [Rhabdochlamydiaceae bacterium]
MSFISFFVIASALVFGFFIFTPSTVPVFFVKCMHPDFAGRQSYLKKLENALIKNHHKGVSGAVLWGESGAGKSETAIAFANLNRSHFSMVFWIETESEDKYRQGYMHLADVLKVRYSSQEPIQSIRDKVHDHLQRSKNSKPWLLIYDNVENPLVLPEQGHGRILLTERYLSPCKRFKQIHVDPFNAEEAYALVKKISKNTPLKEWDALFQRLGFLPIAINLAAHYIDSTPNMTVSTYLDLFEKYRLDLLDHMSPDERYPISLTTTWKISMEALQKSNPLVVEWLTFCSYLYPDSIPVEWIEKWLKFQGIGQTKLKAYDILRTLIEQSFVRYDEESKTVSLHRLKQLTIRDNNPLAQEVKKKTLTFLSNQFREFGCYDALEWGIHRWDKLSQWAPHAAWFIECFAKELQTIELVRLLNILGNYNAMLVSKYQEASNFYEQGIAIVKTLDAVSINYDLALLYANLSFSQDKLEKTDEASAYIQYALKLLDNQNDRNSQILRGEIMYGYASILNWKGEFSKSHEIAQNALHQLEQIFGDEPHPAVIESMKWVGGSYSLMRNHEKAIYFSKRALEMNKKYFHDKFTPQQGFILSNLGFDYLFLNKPEKALLYFEQALEGCSKIYKNGCHLQILFNFMDLAWAHRKLKNYKKSISYLNKALKLNQELFQNPLNVYYSRINKNIGLAWEDLGDYARALKHYNIGLNAIAQQKDSRFEAYILLPLGKLLIKMGKCEEGISKLEKAIEIHLAAMNDKSVPEMIQCYKALGEAYRPINLEKAQTYLKIAQELELEEEKYRDECKKDYLLSKSVSH